MGYHDVPHDALPNDGLIYELYWAGLLLNPRPSDETFRVGTWFREVDSIGNPLSDRYFIQVVESTGSIPKLVTGSFWKNRRITRLRNLPPTRGIVDLEIIAPDRWTAVRAGGEVPVGPGSSRIATWIERSDLRLAIPLSRDHVVPGYQGMVVPAKTVAGEEVIFPCYELFRSFSGATSELALALLLNRWETAHQKLVTSAVVSDDGGVPSLHLELREDVSPGSVPTIAWLYLDSVAREAVDLAHGELIRQRRDRWIVAFPPYRNCVFRIRARVRRLPSRGALLVEQIIGAQCPLMLENLTYSYPNATTFTPDGDHSGTSPEDPRRTTRRTPGSVGRPADRKSSRLVADLPSVSCRLFGLPVPVQKVKAPRVLPAGTRFVEATDEVPVTVSVGAPGAQGKLPGARYTPNEETEILDRFQAVFDLATALVEDGHFEHVREYPIVRPFPPDLPTYCEFDADLSASPRPWTVLRTPNARPRLALVLEIKVDDRLVYWIDIEPIPRQYRAVAVEMTAGGALDAGVAEYVLSVAAKTQGVWPKSFCRASATILAVDAVHTNVGGSLAPSVMLNAIERLIVQRSQREKTQGEQTELSPPST
jgi:hypothetical protein